MGQRRANTLSTPDVPLLLDLNHSITGQGLASQLASWPQIESLQSKTANFVRWPNCPGLTSKSNPNTPDLPGGRRPAPSVPFPGESGREKRIIGRASERLRERKGELITLRGGHALSRTPRIYCLVLQGLVLTNGQGWWDLSAIC